MVDSMGIYKPLIINIETVKKNLECQSLLRIILKLKKCVDIQLKNYLIY